MWVTFANAKATHIFFFFFFFSVKILVYMPYLIIKVLTLRLLKTLLVLNSWALVLWLLVNVIFSVFELHEKMYLQICLQQCLGSDSLPTLTWPHRVDWAVKPQHKHTNKHLAKDPWFLQVNSKFIAPDMRGCWRNIFLVYSWKHISPWKCIVCILWNSSQDYIALHCTEPFIITLPSSWYDSYIGESFQD